MNYKIRLASEKDYPEILAMQIACYYDVVPECDDVIIERLTTYPNGCFVAEFENSIIGYILSHPTYLAKPPRINTKLGNISADVNSYFIHDVSISAEYRKKGIANALIQAIIDHAKSQNYPTLTLIAVQNSELFWSKYGFESMSFDREKQLELDNILAEYHCNLNYMVKALF